eukprot:445308_1
MAQQGSRNKELASLLKINEHKGWEISLFEDQNKISEYICTNCTGICCNAVELGCDHDDADICSYCEQCLHQLITDNDSKCPINDHTDPHITPARSIRNRVLKAAVLCPYSMAYKRKRIYLNKVPQLMDTMNDEQEGSVANQNALNVDIKGCNWNGTLMDLLHHHLPGCVQQYDVSFHQKIQIRELKNENARLNHLSVKLMKENREL